MQRHSRKIKRIKDRNTEETYLTTKYKLPNMRLDKWLCDPNLPSK